MTYSFNRVVTATVVVLLLSGCAGVTKGIARNFQSSVDIAKEDCSSMGYKLGTPEYLQCVNVNTQNIRNARSQAQAAAPRWDRYVPPASNNTSCIRTAQGMNCSTW